MATDASISSVVWRQCLWNWSLWPDMLMVWWTISVWLKHCTFIKWSIRKTVCRSEFPYFITLLFQRTGLSVMVCQDNPTPPALSIQLYIIILYRCLTYGVENKHAPVVARQMHFDLQHICFSWILQVNEYAEVSQTPRWLYRMHLCKQGRVSHKYVSLLELFFIQVLLPTSIVYTYLHKICFISFNF